MYVEECDHGCQSCKLYWYVLRLQLDFIMGFEENTQFIVCQDFGTEVETTAAGKFQDLTSAHYMLRTGLLVPGLPECTTGAQATTVAEIIRRYQNAVEPFHQLPAHLTFQTPFLQPAQGAPSASAPFSVGAAMGPEEPFHNSKVFCSR